MFSIADTLASVSQPRKVEVAPKREESAPLETSDERSKRLRKEQRRKLRVAFKPDENLVSVRFLTPPLEDEQGPNAFDARDAGDIDSEGRMFKLHHDDMDIDEEDDADVGPINDLSRPFGPPSLVDFSTVADEERQRMYIPYGGGVQKPECPEAEMQERREANTLIAVYANASDIPPNPKGPTESVEETVEPKQFGSLPDSVLVSCQSISFLASIFQFHVSLQPLHSFSILSFSTVCGVLAVGVLGRNNASCPLLLSLLIHLIQTTSLSTKSLFILVV